MVLAKQRNLFNQQTLRFPSHIMHVLCHNLLGGLHLLDVYLHYSAYALPCQRSKKSAEKGMCTIMNGNGLCVRDWHCGLYHNSTSVVGYKTVLLM